MNGFYINLDSREDRKEHIEKMKNEISFFKNIERMPAIYKTQNNIGCSLSHIKCLTELLKKNDDHYLIMEDDFFILHKQNFIEFTYYFNLIKNDEDWDMIVLTPRGETQKKNYKGNFHKIIDNQTATGYIIKHKFINTLLENIKDGCVNLMKGYYGPTPNPYVNDQCWKKLQYNNVWLYFYKIFAGQLPGYSDIEKRIVNYNYRFIDQINN